MRKILLILCIILPAFLWANPDSAKVYLGFSGGMMVHTGYLFGQNPKAPRDAEGVLCSPQGACFGIGGALRVNLFKHLRVGGEGMVSTMPSSTTDCNRRLQSGSYVRTGWGGASADVCWRGEKVWSYIGGTIGGGAMRLLYILDGNENDWVEENLVLFNKQSFFFVDPYVGLDWCMSQKIHVIFRFDWQIALHHQSLVQPTGPRFYMGFMFCH